MPQSAQYQYCLARRAIPVLHIFETQMPLSFRENRFQGSGGTLRFDAPDAASARDPRSSVSMHAAGMFPFRESGLLRTDRCQKFMRLKAEGGCETFDRAQPNFLFPAGFNLLKKVLRKIGDFGEFLLRQAMTLAQFTQARPDFIQRCHTSDRRGKRLTFLPAITCILQK